MLAGAIVGALSASAASSTAPTAALQTCAAGLNGQVPTPTPPDFKFSGNVRQYYVAAEEVEWDYAPTGWDNWMGVRNLRRRTIEYAIDQARIGSHERFHKSQHG